jgi:hypothetical protein
VAIFMAGEYTSCSLERLVTCEENSLRKNDDPIARVVSQHALPKMLVDRIEISKVAAALAQNDSVRF